MENQVVSFFRLILAYIITYSQSLNQIREPKIQTYPISHGITHMDHSQYTGWLKPPVYIPFKV